jgi:hypothetical protein
VQFLMLVVFIIIGYSGWASSRSAQRSGKSDIATSGMVAAPSRLKSHLPEASRTDVVPQSTSDAAN